jgi:hypothetical protein
MVAHEVATERTTPTWLWGSPGVKPPIVFTANTVMIAYGAAMEIGCLRALGWAPPAYVIDLYAEFRVLTNGTRPPGTNGLLDACAAYGIKHAYSDIEKESLQQCAARGGPFDPPVMLDYCGWDTRVTVELFKKMLPSLDIDRALIRGEYVKCVGEIEARGVPIDQELQATLIQKHPDLQNQLSVAARFRYPRTFEGTSFSEAGFEWWLRRRGYWWPRDPKSGHLKLDADTFDTMVNFYPELRFLKHTRSILSECHALKLEVGRDGRNRASVKPFTAKTGRNQPSTTRAIFGGPSWQRSLIRPEPGKPLAYIDYEQQEFGIAAALSGDLAMMEAYRSGDAYMAFAISSGAAPIGATKRTHATVRDVYKIVVLAVGYGQSARSLARRLNIQTVYAEKLLAQHRRLYPRYWRWSDDVSATFHLRGEQRAALGWQIKFTELTDNDLSTRNWPAQTAGSEILRIAVILATQAGVKICALVHDALLIESTDDEIDDAVSRTQAAMQKAGEIVLGGFKLRTERTDKTVVRYPDHYVDKRGLETWGVIRKVLLG